MNVALLRRSAAIGLTVLAGIAQVACGNNPGGPGSTVTISSLSTLDGWAQSNGVVVVNGGGPLTGDLEGSAPGVSYRQFYSFDLATLPAGAHIVSATLKLYQAQVIGDPYTNLGNVIVDHVDFGASLDAADFNAAALTSNVGTLSTAAVVGYKTLDVMTQVQADRTASRTRTQFRLRFSLKDSNNDGKNDYVSFTDFEDSCCAVNKTPQLVIEYTM